MEREDPTTEKLLQYDQLIGHVKKTNGPLNHDLIVKIDGLIADIDQEDDPVYQGNVLQTIADIASSPYALIFLEDRKVPEKLICLLRKGDTLLIPHTLKFFYHVNPQHLNEKYREVLDIILDYFSSDDSQLMDFAVDFVATVARQGHESRESLLKHDQFSSKCLKKLGSLIVCSNSLLKCRTLECIRDLMEPRLEDSIESSSQQSERIYHQIIEGEHKMTKQLLALCQVPFKEISSSAGLVVKVVSDYEWGKKELSTQPEIMKFIPSHSSNNLVMYGPSN